MMEVPVFVVAGFLDSGKSTFIKDAIEKDGFDKNGRTLVILCEEGEVELTEEFGKQHNTSIVAIDNSDDFNAEHLSELVAKFIPDRIIIELNCMWDLKGLYFPDGLQVSQVITFIDGSTFEVYYNNIRQKFKDMIELSDLVVFKRIEDVSKLSNYRTSLKLMNATAQFVIMDDTGMTKKAFEDPLPYDITKDIITIKDEDYGRWYIDTFDNPKRYNNKKVEFNGIVTVSKKLPKGSFIVGRYAMTCCAQDVQLYGHLCMNIVNAKVKNKMWVHVIATVKFEYSKEYEEDELVLYPEKITQIEPLKDAILDLR